MAKLTAKTAGVMIIAAGCMWGTMGFFNRNITASGLGQLQIVYCRLLLAAAGLAVLLWSKDRSLFKVRIKDIWCFVGTGLLSMLCLNITYFCAMQYMTLSAAAFLLSTSPAYVMLLSAVLFHERLNKHKLLALGIMFVGCIFITGVAEGTLELSWKGILFGLASGVSYAMYSIFSRFALNKGYRSETISFYTFFFASLGILPFGSAREIAAVMDARLVILIIAMALLTCILPYMFYTKGLSGVENSTAAILATSEPVMATLLGAVCFHEKMSLGNAMGIVLLVCSIVIMNFQGTSKHKEYN